MRLHIACVGRMKAGAERDLLERYLERGKKSGRTLGITQINLIELAESRAPQASARKASEADALLTALPDGARVVALDETGKSLTSETFASKFDAWRNEGCADLAFVIGGPDGHGDKLLSKADLKLSLGAMTWPHQIARVLLCEQIYRACTILTGHPYHRV